MYPVVVPDEARHWIFPRLGGQGRHGGKAPVQRSIRAVLFPVDTRDQRLHYFNIINFKNLDSNRNLPSLLSRLLISFEYPRWKISSASQHQDSILLQIVYTRYLVHSLTHFLTCQMRAPPDDLRDAAAPPVAVVVVDDVAAADAPVASWAARCGDGGAGSDPHRADRPPPPRHRHRCSLRTDGWMDHEEYFMKPCRF